MLSLLVSVPVQLLLRGVASVRLWISNDVLFGDFPTPRRALSR